MYANNHLLNVIDHLRYYDTRSLLIMLDDVLRREMHLLDECLRQYGLNINTLIMYSVTYNIMQKYVCTRKKQITALFNNTPNF